MGLPPLSWEPYYAHRGDNHFLYWKSGSQDYSADRRVAFDHRWHLDEATGVEGRLHTVTGLDNGTEYTFRILTFDSEDYDAASSNEVTVTPVDMTAPALRAENPIIITDNQPHTVTITFDEPLDSGSVPPASAFTVTAGGTAATVSTVTILEHPVTREPGPIVTLFLADDIAAGATVTVAYTAPTGTGTTPIQDTSSNPAESFAATTAANRPAAPFLLASFVTAVDNGLEIQMAPPGDRGGSALTRVEIQLKDSTQPDSAYRTVLDDTGTWVLNTGQHTIGEVLDPAVTYTVRIRYSNAAGPGPWSATLDGTPDPPTAPVADAAQTRVDPADPAKVRIYFGEAMLGFLLPSATAFAVTIDSAAPVAPSGVAVSGEQVVLTMGTAVAAGATVSAGYIKPASGNLLRDADGSEVASFTVDVGNRPAAPALTLTTAAGQITAAWTAPANGGSAVTGYELQYKLATDTAWTAVTVDPPTSLSAVISGLTDSGDFDVRVRAANAAGAGPWATDAATVPETDTTAPAMRADNPIIITEADPDTITIHYDEPLDTASVPPASAFALTGSGVFDVQTVTGVAIPADAPSTVTLSLSGNAEAGRRYTVAYTAPTGAAATPIQDTSSNAAASFTATAAANRPARPAIRLSPRDNALWYVVTASSDGGSAMTRRQVQIKVATEPDTAYTVIDDDTGTYGANSSFNGRHGGLDPAVTYRLRARYWKRGRTQSVEPCGVGDARSAHCACRRRRTHPRRPRRSGHGAHRLRRTDARDPSVGAVRVRAHRRRRGRGQPVRGGARPRQRPSAAAHHGRRDRRRRDRVGGLHPALRSGRRAPRQWEVAGRVVRRGGGQPACRADAHGRAA